MDLASKIILLVATVAVVSAAARRISVPAPLLLVAAGIAASFIPGTPDYELDPEMVLVGILPPLLYAAAIRTSLIDVRRDRRAIALLSVGLVAFTCVVVGFISWLLIPELPLAAGFALGAVVAPPDAVAATAVGRRVGLPRRMTNILEGESLLNDAIALVALRTSVAALAGSITAWRIGVEATVAAVGGTVVGLAVGAVLIAVRRRVENVVLDTTLSLLAPFVAFIAAEELSISHTHPSGVLAVVIAGAMLGHYTDQLQSARARISERINWETIQFVLENSVFLLIGLQVRDVLDDVSRSSLGGGRLLLICGGVLLATIVSRFVWVFPATYLPRLIPAIRRIDPPPPWQVPAGVAWAGMRGVVTLAAVFALPESTPHRPVLVLAAFTVVAGTLLLQGATLPLVIRRLRLRGPDPAEDALAEAGALQEAARAGLARLDELAAGAPPEVVARLRERTLERANHSWERLGAVGAETPSDAYRRLRLEMLAAERAAVQERRGAGLLEADLLLDVRHVLDVEESQLDRPVRDVDTSSGTPLVAATGATCGHLQQTWPFDQPPGEPVCRRCIEEGTQPVHLRMCLACGEVACCDSSVGRHATAHYEATHHSVMRSVEPGEAWRWCYLDQRLG
ncbi:MAG: cation:proton antiporter [Acidimicrobiia bacterium]